MEIVEALSELEVVASPKARTPGAVVELARPAVVPERDLAPCLTFALPVLDPPTEDSACSVEAVADGGEADEEEHGADERVAVEAKDGPLAA